MAAAFWAGLKRPEGEFEMSPDDIRKFMCDGAASAISGSDAKAAEPPRRCQVPSTWRTHKPTELRVLHTRQVTSERESPRWRRESRASYPTCNPAKEPPPSAPVYIKNHETGPRCRASERKESALRAPFRPSALPSTHHRRRPRTLTPPHHAPPKRVLVDPPRARGHRQMDGWPNPCGGTCRPSPSS